MEPGFDLSQFVSSLKSSHKKVAAASQQQLSVIYTDKDIINFLKEIDADSLFINSTVASKVADYLQLLNNELNYRDLPLEKIGEIYQYLMQSSEYDISVYESYAYFLNNVMGLNEEGRAILMQGINKIESRISRLKEGFVDFD